VADPRLALIVGAGIGGLAAGVELRRTGWGVRIFERAAHPRELGFALLLASNAVASLQRLGLAGPVIAGGSVVEAGAIHGTAGRLLRRFDVTQVRHVLAHPPVVVLRPVLHGVLLDAVGHENLVLDSEACGFSIQDGKPVLQLVDGRRAKGDVLIGADGVGSVIRRALHADEPPPRASGLWSVRGVAYDMEPHIVALNGAQYFGHGTEGGIARASRSAIYWYLSVPARQLAGSRDPGEIARRCAGDFDDHFREIVSATQVEDMRLDELLDRDPIAEWGRGPVTLLGDAAHPMLPHAGQGAAQALEDAVALGRALDGVADMNAALRSYERVRAKRTHDIVLLARRNARIGSVDSAAGQWLRDMVIRFVPASVLMKTYIEFGKPPTPD
jgi:2-polyprenyl-6-methoxyphenol hydroxylase-like FAD-dependent oxidoreductase